MPPFHLASPDLVPRVFAIDPGNTQALVRRAQAYQALGRFRSGVEDLEAAEASILASIDALGPRVDRGAGGEGLVSEELEEELVEVVRRLEHARWTKVRGFRPGWCCVSRGEISVDAVLFLCFPFCYVLVVCVMGCCKAVLAVALRAALSDRVAAGSSRIVTTVRYDAVRYGMRWHSLHQLYVFCHGTLPPVYTLKCVDEFQRHYFLSMFG